MSTYIRRISHWWKVYEVFPLPIVIFTCLVGEPIMRSDHFRANNSARCPRSRWSMLSSWRTHCDQKETGLCQFPCDGIRARWICWSLIHALARQSTDFHWAARILTRATCNALRVDNVCVPIDGKNQRRHLKKNLSNNFALEAIFNFNSKINHFLRPRIIPWYFFISMDMKWI